MPDAMYATYGHDTATSLILKGLFLSRNCRRSFAPAGFLFGISVVPEVFAEGALGAIPMGPDITASST